jgi:hypothetical protein
MTAEHDIYERPGRPPCYSQERAERVIEAVRRGLTYKQAAAYAGISYSTLNRWRREGSRAEDEQEPSEFWEFWKALEQANGEAAYRLVGCIDSAAEKGDWKAASWILSKRFPCEWGSKPDPYQDPLEPMFDM